VFESVNEGDCWNTLRIVFPKIELIKSLFEII
jgi:hypothetical protein